MNRSSLILVTGATGMVGSALLHVLRSRLYERLLAPTRLELNLLNQDQVSSYFAKHRPDYVFMIAAKVGGIGANQSDPVGFLRENLSIQLNLLKACHECQTKKNLFLGSSCVYPRDCPQPMKEGYLLTGLIEPTNEGYAIAKIAGLKLAEYYHTQHRMLTVCPMACNIYGTNDHFDLDRAHVLSALVRRFVDAQDENVPFITLWGTGVARREFIHVNDMAEALLLLMEQRDTPDIINVGTGKDISIRDLATLISNIVGYTGEIRWDPTKPDGMPRRCLDISKLNKMGFQARIDLEEGIQRTIHEYRQSKLRGRIDE
jgi:GDP-L-fucose synthase